MVVIDTDVMIDLLRSHEPAVTWLTSLGSTELVLPGYVALELLQGCRSKLEQDRVLRTLVNCRIEWPIAIDCMAAMTTFTQFHLSHNIGFIDALIAHTAMMLDAPLYTFNQKHYDAISGLTTIQPYARIGS